MLQPQVIHRDADYLVVDKPSGLPTTAPSASEPSLAAWVRDRFPDLSAHPSSRLDSPVTGVVTFALNKKANERLLHARRDRTYERVYLGLTAHAIEPDRGEWTWPIAIHPSNPKLRVAGPGRGQREAVTRYELLARTNHASLLRLMPETGRTHQLRVHAAAAGAPLLGDRAYGGERRITMPSGKVVTARRAMLHCAMVAFPGPTGTLRLRAPIPEDFARAWSSVGGREVEP